MFVSPYWARLMAPVLGWLVAGFWGALAAFALGLALDYWRLLRPFADRAWPDPTLTTRDRRFLITAFALMGHLAKADGRVSEQEVETARVIMDELGLNRQRRRHAIALFNRGKVRPFPLAALILLFRRHRPGEEQRERLLGYLVRIARADGLPTDVEKALLHRICRLLGLEYAHLAQLLRRNEGRPASRDSSLRRTLSSAYQLLGVRETASDAEVKQAYRRCISRNHPDRMVAAGVSEAEVQAATQRTHAIRQAYEEIRRARNM